MANNEREGEGERVDNVNIEGNSAHPGSSANPNIQNSNTLIQGQAQVQDQSRVPYGYNHSGYPAAPSNMLYLQPNHNQGLHSVDTAGNSIYPYMQNSNMMIQRQWQDPNQDQGRVPYGCNQAWYPRAPQQDQDQSRGPYGYNQAWYPRPPSNMLYVQQPNYTYPNPAPAMDMNMNMNSYNDGYYHHPPIDGRFHIPLQPQLPVQPQPQPQLPVQPQSQLSVQAQPWQPQPQSQLSVQAQPWQPQSQLSVQAQPWQPQPQLPEQPQPQPQPRPQPQPVFDAGRRGSSCRHSTGRNSNTLQAGRGRGRVLKHNNCNNYRSCCNFLSGVGELLMSFSIHDDERSIERQGQGQGHAEPDQHANADAVSGEYSNAKFFVIKSYSRENVVISIKNKLWTSTSTGNRILSAAYNGEAHHEKQSVNASCPVFLFFSVQRSGNFCGMAEMDGPVDLHTFANCWNGNWKGKFPVKWHIIKDVPYSEFVHITINTAENPNQTSIIHSRDTQEVEFENGLEMLYIFKSYVSSTSVLDDASTSTALPQNSCGNQRWKINNKREEKKEQEQDQEEEPAVDAKQKGKEKEEEGCSQYCVGSASYDTSSNQIKQQDTIEESPSDMQLQKIENTDQEQEEEVEDKQKGKEKEEVDNKQKGKEKEMVDDKQKGKEEKEEGGQRCRHWQCHL